MQIGQRLLIIELADLGEHPAHDVHQLGDGLDERSQIAGVVLIGVASFRIVEKQRLRTLFSPRGELPDERHVVARLEMTSRGLEVLASFQIEDPRGGLLPGRRRILVRLEALGLHEHRPARPKPLERVVEAGDGTDQLGLA